MTAGFDVTSGAIVQTFTFSSLPTSSLMAYFSPFFFFPLLFSAPIMTSVPQPLVRRSLTPRLCGKHLSISIRVTRVLK